MLLLLSLPGIIWYVIFSYLPMSAIVLAFQRYRVHGNFFQSITQSEFVGLANFQILFRSGDAALIIRNTVLYNLLFIVLGIVVPMIFALALFEMHSRFFSKLYQSLLFIPFFLSMMVISYIVFGFLDHTNGFVNSVLTSFGLDPINFYRETAWWPFILPLVNTWRGMGYNMIIFLAAMCGLDKSYYEAAMIDGANQWQKIKRITLPLLKPILIILIILSVGNIMRADFGLFFHVPRNSGPLFPVTQVIDTFIFRGLRNLGDFSITAATGLLQSVVGLVLVIATNAIVRKLDSDAAMF